MSISDISLYFSFVVIWWVLIIFLLKYNKIKGWFKNIYLALFVFACLYAFYYYFNALILVNSIWDKAHPDVSSWELINSILDTYDSSLNISKIEDLKDNNCDIENLKGYKTIPIFDKEVVWFNKNDYTDYSNKFKIEKWIKEAYFCVVADVKEPLRNAGGTYYLYVFINWWYMGGLVNVWFSKTNNIYYDYKSSWNPDLDWRMYWLLTPKTYLLNLNSLIVADYKNWWYKNIRPIDQLNVWWTQRIWGFVSAWQNGIIKKFILIYTWGNISPIE